MAISSQILVQQNNQLLGYVDQIEEQFNKFKKDALQLLRDVKSGTIEPSRIVVTDNGWDVMPEKKKKNESSD